MIKAISKDLKLPKKCSYGEKSFIVQVDFNIKGRTLTKQLKKQSFIAQQNLQALFRSIGLFVLGVGKSSSCCLV
jgi:hypothetical protein